MCRKPVIEIALPPSITLNCIDANSFSQLLKAQFPGAKLKMDDYWYYYPSWDDWGKILGYVQDESRMRKYVPEKFDCDNFARYISVMCSYYFECNTCGVAEGYIDNSRHKWNLIFDGEGLTQLESQKKEDFYEPDDSRYIPDEFYFG